jgi:hypothetical protein
MVGAEESLRIKAGVFANDAAKQREAPTARYASGINSNTLSQNVFSKPGACLFGRAMVWNSRTN